MGVGDGEASSAERVAQFLERVVQDRRRPSEEELQAVRPALEDLHAKLMRLRSYGPEYGKIDFSPEMWAVMRLIGKRAEPVGGESVLRRIAASFLSL